jgi:hypothetical protein
MKVIEFEISGIFFIQILWVMLLSMYNIISQEDNGLVSQLY